ncbi:MAG: Ig-like domain-containing protein [Tannerella sp.]|nr:Ig-like domain-containing protein [Tannerella sp.]
MKKVLKLMAGMLATATFALSITSCVEDEDKDRTNNGSESAIMVVPYETDIRVGATRLLTATVLPLNSGTPNVTWTSSDANIVSVSGSGIRGEITGTGEGTTTVTASANGKSATCVVTVTPAIPMTGLAIVPGSDTVIVAGRTSQFNAVPVPEDATNYIPVWTTSDNAVATISTTGLVTAVAPGVATVIVTSAGISDSVDIRVIPVVPLNDFTVTPDALPITSPGTAKQFEVVLDPENTTEYFPEWSSSNPSVATVSETGLLDILAPGNTTITLTSGNISKHVDVTVLSADAIYSRVKGYWTFDDPSNIAKATVGNDLEFVRVDEFSTLGVETGPAEGPSPSNGSAFIPRGSWIKCLHGIPANGGGSRVNEYTIMLDVKPMLVDANAYFSLIQMDADNASEADLYIKSRGRIGGDSPPPLGTTGEYVVVAKKWYRIIFTVKIGDGGYCNYYLNGAILMENSASGVDGKGSLDTNGIIFFGDGLPPSLGGGGNATYNDENLYVAGIAIWDYALSADDIATLNGY